MPPDFLTDEMQKVSHDQNIQIVGYSHLLHETIYS